MMAEKPPKKNWQLVLSLVLSALGILYFLIQSLALGVLWLTEIVTAQADMTQAVSIGLLAWASILGGILLLPVLLLNIYSLRDQPIPSWLDTSRPTISKIVRWLIVVWPIVVFLGWLAAGSPRTAAFLLGPINVIAAGLPVLWTYTTAQWKLETGPQLRKWRIFGLSLVVTPILAIFVELITMLLLILIATLWMTYRIAIDPTLEYTLNFIFNKVLLAGEDLEILFQQLKPYLLQPAVIFWTAAVFGGIIPIIEEVIKPLALWSLAGSKLTPREGFIGGILCGAGFALLENVLYTSTFIVAEDWLFMTIGRAGTAALHMLGSGLIGWGLAKGWREGKWAFQVLMTLIAILLHGIWNVLSLISGVAPLYLYGSDPTFWQSFVFYTPLIALFIIFTASLFLIRRYFYKQTLVNSALDSGGVDSI